MSSIHNAMNSFRCCYVIKPVNTCKAYWSLLILTVVPKYRCSHVLVRTFCCWSYRQMRNQYRSDIDSGTWQQYSGGTQQQLPKSNKPNIKCCHAQNVCFINFCKGLTAARPSIFISNDCPVICFYIHQSPS